MKEKCKHTGKTNWPVTILLIMGCFTIFFPLYMAVIIAFKKPSEMTNDIMGALSFPSSWSFDNFGGHLIDIAGYPKFKELILDGVELNPECLVAEELYWTESEQRANIHLKPLEQHKKAGPQN